MNEISSHSLKDMFSKILDYIIWEFESYEVTIRKIVIAIIVFLCFYFIANWSSLKGDIRTKVSIGIGYSSDIHKATELILSALKKSNKVLNYPEPFVVFKEHGNSTLNFDIYFTVHAKNNIQKIKCESEVNYNLNDTLREAGIEIAFPQRDIHLDSKQPLDIKLIT